jgi:hypothetical protein
MLGRLAREIAAAIGDAVNLGLTAKGLFGHLFQRRSRYFAS